MTASDREGMQALLRFLQRVGGLDSRDASRLERLATDKQQPIIELLEREGIITQRDLAVLLGEALQLPLGRRLPSPTSNSQSRLSQSATRAAIAMVLDDAMTKLASGAKPELPKGQVPKLTVPTPSPAPARSFRALVVDDEPDLRVFVRFAIERSGLGLTVIAAKDAAEALVLVAMERPDIVILDLGMPGIDGFEVCRRLKRAARTKAMPVMILSALGTTESIARAKELGADDYVVKPFRREDFIERIRHLLERAHGISGAAA